MSDYIDILLTALEDELFPSLGKDYFLPLQQANDALTALSATLTDQQRALLDSYEDASAAAGSASASSRDSASTRDSAFFIQISSFVAFSLLNSVDDSWRENVSKILLDFYRTFVVL